MPYSPNTVVNVDDSSLEYWMWSLQGASDAGVSSPGLFRSGHAYGSNKPHRSQGIAAQESIRRGLNMYKAMAQVDMTADSAPLLLNSLRGSNQLPAYLKVHAGATQLGWALTHALINSAKWMFSDAEGPVTLDFELEALAGVSGSGAVTQAVLTGPVFVALETVLLIGATDYYCIRGEGEVKNNMKPATHAGTKTNPADPTHWDIGREEHTVKVKLRKPITADPTITWPANYGLVTTFGDQLGNSLALTYTGLEIEDPSHKPDLKGTGTLDYDYSLIGPWGCLNAVYTPHS